MAGDHPPKSGRGGKREGAGRKPGPNTLRYGEVKALAACKLRLPADAPPEHEQLAAFGLERIIAVAAGVVPAFKAGATLKAATRIREEVCGPLPQRQEHTGKDGELLTVSININRGPKAEGGE